MEAKKNKSVDYLGKRNLFLSIGLCASTLLALSAFQIRTETKPEVLTGRYVLPADIFDEVEQTKFKEPEPPKPKPQPVLIDIVEDDVPLEDLDMPLFEYDEEDALSDYEDYDMPDEEVVPSGIVIAEEPANFPGGLEAWAKFLRKNLEYPRIAKRGGIEGKVLLSFVVDSQGKVSDIEVLRGIGGGCDEEAVRVLKLAPKWNPGLQRGHPVKSRMSLYIHFVLK